MLNKSITNYSTNYSRRSKLQKSIQPSNNDQTYSYNDIVVFNIGVLPQASY